MYTTCYYTRPQRLLLRRRIAPPSLPLCTCVRWHQTANPPRQRVPLDAKPLTRWSRALRPWRCVHALLPHFRVGLDGCHAAFNAMNAIRTTQFFATATPPTFLRASSSRDIAHLQQHLARGNDDDTAAAAATANGDSSRAVSIDDLACFRAHSFWHDDDDDSDDSDSSSRRCAVIALENFAPGARSILRTRVPHAARLVVGHENDGVLSVLTTAAAAVASSCSSSSCSTARLPAQPTMVLYIPQYGTISSLNVVTALGIALFYAYLDTHHPHARTLATTTTTMTSADDDDDATLPSLSATAIRHYQRYFSEALPHMSSCHNNNNNSSGDDVSADDGGRRRTVGVGRVDARPLHPAYYTRSLNDIRGAHTRYRDALLRYSHDTDNASTSVTTTTTTTTSSTRARPSRRRFGVSVLYENECDQRNFGGLLRSANAFLVDTVCYTGRRKYNVVGALGCQHYTPPVYIAHDFARTSDAAAAAQLRARVEAQCGGKCRWWLLDCGHDYAARPTCTHRHTATAAMARNKDNIHKDNDDDDSSACDVCRHYYSATASLQWWRQMTQQRSDDTTSLCLCDDEATLRRAAGCNDDSNNDSNNDSENGSENGSVTRSHDDDTDACVLLVVPQEGKLPHMHILTHCTRVVTVLPRTRQRSPGLPTQVASGIALQRLAAVLHPRLAAL